MGPKTKDRICQAFRIWTKAKITPFGRKPDAGDTVAFLVHVLGQSHEACTLDELVALLRSRNLIK